MGTTTPYAKLHVTQGSTTPIDCIPLKLATGVYSGNLIGVPNGTATLLGLCTELTNFCKAGIGHCRTSDFANIWDIGDIVFCINSALNSTEVNSTHEKMRIKYNGNVGIGTTNPQSSYKLQVQGNIWCENTLVFSNNYNGGGGDYACNKLSLFGGGNTPTTSGNYGFGISSYTLDYFAAQYHRFRYGITIGGTNFGSVGMELNNNNLNVGGNIYAGSYFDCGGAGGGYFQFYCPDAWIRLRNSGGVHRDFAAGSIYAHNNLYGNFVSRSGTGTDYLCVDGNATSLGQGLHGQIMSAYGSFTEFHRCYTDDELYNNDTDENIDLFKNNFMGRVVIATGKIKTDFTRNVEAPEPTEPDTSDIKKAPDTEWYSVIDKDGISVEDAVPVVALSRKKKDKRVFGVLGAPKRNTNNKNRLIVNSVGEGAICVSNTNGNIENGDYIQSSDLLGYGEKQDDDLLHNYTIAKATIDCNFELDSAYYQCHEIENGVRVAFIACSYHCG